MRIRTASLEPVTSTLWMTSSPSEGPKGRREQLAPGVWIIHEAQWLPPAALDTAALRPWDDTIEPVHRDFPYPEWHDDALCRGVVDSDDIFFGVDDVERPALPPRAILRARALCTACPVAVTCLTWAFEHDERFGIWAGTTGRQRAELRKRLSAGETIPGLVKECLAP